MRISLHRGVPGSAGCQPAGFGSLPKRTSLVGIDRKNILVGAQNVVGRLPTTTGWQPVLLNPFAP